MALPLFLANSGFPLFYVFNGAYPRLYGLHMEHLDAVLVYLAASSWAFTLGTLLVAPSDVMNQILPPLRFTPKSTGRFHFWLILALLTVSGISYYGLYKLNFFELLSLHYGANQWANIDTNPWLRASVLGTPLLCMLILYSGVNCLALGSFKLLFLCVVSLLPAVILGGRKDLIFVVIAFALAGSLRRGFNSMKPILIVLVILGAFNYLQTLSRDAASLNIDSRLESLKSNHDAEDTLVGQIGVALPVAPTVTAAMTIFPQREPFDLGASYAKTIVSTMLPKVIFYTPVFMSPNEKFHALYYPEVTNFSMDYSMAAEGYQNFGMLGALVPFLFMGALLANSKRAAATFENSLWIYMHFVVFMYGMWSLRSDSNTFFKMTIYGSLLLVTFYVLSRLTLFRRATAS